MTIDHKLGDLPEYWQSSGVIFTGKGFGDVHGVRFFDLNGDVSVSSCLFVHNHPDLRTVILMPD